MTGSSARCPDLEPIAGPSETLYVSPDGDDSASGDENAPLASLSEAARRFPSGGTVIVRGGVYPPEVWFRASGSAGSLLYIRAAEGETPIFDGSQVQDEWSAVIMMESASHVVFEGLEVRNCSAPSCQGIKVYGPVLDLTVRNCHIHHMDGPAARFAGKKIRIEGNDFHDIALTNVDNIAYPTGGWPTCTGTSPDRSNPSDPWADDVVIRANRIRDCWGEGIGLWYASNAIVQDNSIENAWNVGIYADNAFNLRIERNYVHMLRGLNGGAGKGILFGTEDYSGWGLAGARTSNVVTANNVVVAGTGIGWWAEQTEHSTYEAISLLHNTVVGTHRGALNFNEVKSSVDGPTDCVAKNNVFAGAEDSWLGNPDALEFGGNAWLNDPAPAFAGASDVSLEIPLGNWSNGVDARSIATQVGKGGAGAGVIDDFLCGPRDLDSPTRGAFE
jgi:parallel beta-helix repeat protein